MIMKKIKRLAALMLAVVMVLAMSITAFATDGGETPSTPPEGGNESTETPAPEAPTTTVGKTEGHTYQLYQIFTGVYDATSGRLSDIKWGQNGKGGTAGSLVSENVLEDLTKVASSNKDTEKLGIIEKYVDLDSDTFKAEGVALDTTGGKIKYTGLPAGYYLIRDQAGSLEGKENEAYTFYIVQVTDGTLEVTPKADVPSIDKDIQNADSATGTADGKGTAVNVGDTVAFKLTSTVPKMKEYGYTKYTYIVTDTMSNGLTFNSEVAPVVKVGGTTLTNEVDYTYKYDGQVLTVTFVPERFINLTEGAEIEITYTATLNENALDTSVEVNKVKLTYSNDPKNEGTGETPEKEVYVYDFDIDINKYQEGDETQKLAGAVFVLKNSDGKYYKVNDKKEVDWVNDIDDATKVKTDAKGHAKFTGLDSGTYNLEEVEAPAGYNKLTEDVVVNITVTYDAEGKITSTSVESTGDGQYIHTENIDNKKGSLLPSTGGIGTTIFYIVGAIIVIGAGVILVVKKRMSNE